MRTENYIVSMGAYLGPYASSQNHACRKKEVCKKEVRMNERLRYVYI